MVPTQPHEYVLKPLYLLPEFTIPFPWLSQLVEDGGSLNELIPKKM